jgi:hypothetical protein
LLIEGRDRGGLERELVVDHLGLCAAYLVFVEEGIAIVSVIPYSSVGTYHICPFGTNTYAWFEEYLGSLTLIDRHRSWISKYAVYTPHETAIIAEAYR